MALITDEVKKQVQASVASQSASIGTTNAVATTNAAATTTTTTATTTTATTTTSSYSNTSAANDIYSEVKAEEEKEKKAKQQDNKSSLPVWLQADSYEDDSEDDEVTEEDISNALNEIVQFELSEKGKADTIYYSDNYNQGFTHNGKVVNGSCTEGGMKKAILGGEKYISVTNSDGETMSGVEAMADSYDSVLDLLTQQKFQEVLEEYGYGTFTNNCNFLKHADEIREKYGIDIKVIETQRNGEKDVAGVQNRTFEISLVDEEGNIIEDEEGNKSTILFGDWVIPDGCAQGAEFDFISVIDQAGYDCISKADFIDNEAFKNDPQFQDENGNYDAGKAYAYVIGQLENEFNSVKNGGSSDIMKASDQTINEATYKSCTFDWWRAGGGDKYYSNSGLDSSLLGGVVSDLEKAFDINNDGVLSEDEQAKMLESVTDDEGNAKKAEKAAKEANNTDKQNADKTAATSAFEQIENRNILELEGIIEQAQAENPEADVSEIIEDYAKKHKFNEDELTDMLK